MEMFSVKKLLILAGTLLILFVGFPFQAGAESSAEKKADIRKLLEVTGIKDQLAYMKTSLLKSYSVVVTSTYPKIPKEFWDDYNDLIGQKDLEKLVDEVVPIYEKHMSHDAIKKLVEMFDTPFWNEWKNKMPIISKEAGVTGSQWGQKKVQSKEFTDKLDALIKKHKLEDLNKKKEEPKKKEQDAPQTKKESPKP